MLKTVRHNAANTATPIYTMRLGVGRLLAARVSRNLGASRGHIGFRGGSGAAAHFTLSSRKPGDSDRATGCVTWNSDGIRFVAGGVVVSRPTSGALINTVGGCSTGRTCSSSVDGIILGISPKCGPGLASGAFINIIAAGSAA